MEAMDVDAEIWRGKRVLVTGHTGFKGAWLALWLESLGADVHGLALPPADKRGAWCAMQPWIGVASHEVDLRDEATLRDVISRVRPEVVFHLAAQATVRGGYADPTGTYATNVVGTVNLLDAVRSAATAGAMVVVTSDKVYENSGTDLAFTEFDRLGGSDPYSSSKACAELAVASWRRSFPTDLRLATARAGNVLGGGDRGRDRLLPDLLDAVEAERPLRLRYPGATRPWQFVLDPLRGYLLLAQHLLLAHTPEAHAVNFGPPAGAGTPVHELVKEMLALWGTGSWERDPAVSGPEAPFLRLDAGLAGRLLGWRPRVDLATSLKWTAAWWREAAEGHDLREFALAQLNAYRTLLDE